MAKGNDAVTKEEKRAASASASGDKYPGIEGADAGRGGCVFGSVG